MTVFLASPPSLPAWTTGRGGDRAFLSRGWHSGRGRPCVGRRCTSLESRAGQTGCQKTFPPPPATATQCSLLYVAEGHKLFPPNYRPPAVFPPRRPPLDSAATEQPPLLFLKSFPPRRNVTFPLPWSGEKGPFLFYTMATSGRAVPPVVVVWSCKAHKLPSSFPPFAISLPLLPIPINERPIVCFLGGIGCVSVLFEAFVVCLTQPAGGCCRRMPRAKRTKLCSEKNKAGLHLQFFSTQEQNYNIMIVNSFSNPDVRKSKKILIHTKLGVKSQKKYFAGKFLWSVS